MALANMYYMTKWNCYPFETDDNYKKTESFIEFLKDNKYTDSEILEIINNSKKDDYMNIDSLDESIWDDNLTNKGEFYYHRELRIKPEGPYWEPGMKKEDKKKQKHYLEMRIKYTIRDLINYYYFTFNVNTMFRDYNRDKGALEYLIKRYSVLDNIPAIDFILHLIDFTQSKGDVVTNPLDISKNEIENYELMRRKMDEAEFCKVNKIIWR